MSLFDDMELGFVPPAMSDEEILEADLVVTDTANLEGERCGLCMDLITDRGVLDVLDCCQHWFCFTCIDNWTTITNLCPLCQSEFQLITCVPVYNTIGSSSLKRSQSQEHPCNSCEGRISFDEDLIKAEVCHDEQVNLSFGSSTLLTLSCPSSNPFYAWFFEEKCSSWIAVVACLVQCVYVLELDRQKKRKGDKALAPPWRETFGFKLKCKLVDKADSSIFGAIFKYKPPPYSCNHSAGGPRFVVAFRGTLFKKKSLVQDTWLDVQVILNNLHSTSRCQTAIQEVEDLVATAGYSGEVWLTGHSLGSAIGMQAGKNMAKKGVYLESLLFNPPYPSVLTEKIKSKTLKLTLHLAKSVLHAGVAVAKQSPLQWKQSESSFAAMSPWAPKLFVNEADYVCFEYIGYFRYGNWMRKHRLENIYKFASQYNLRSLMLMSKKEAQAEPLYLIPSANLTINSKQTKCFLSAHRLSQWWRQDQELESEVY